MDGFDGTLSVDEKIQSSKDAGTNSFAIFSACERYRFVLHRRWGDAKLRCMNFIMLNPSTADAFKNDPTVARCENRARQMGYSAFSVTNLFAYRSTAPSHLLWPKVEPIGQRNREWILWAAQRAETVVVAWGNHGALRRDNIIRWDLQVLEALIMRGVNPMCLGQNAGGSPKHPLYLKKDLELRPFIESVL